MAKRNYNPNAVILTINGIRIEGGTDDFVVYSWNSSLYTMTRDLTGESTASFVTDRSGTLAVKVHASSLGYKRLGEVADLFTAAGEAGEPAPACSIRLANRLTGEKIVESEAVLTDLPGIELGASAGEREFKFDLPNARRNVRYAPSVT